MCLNDKKSWKFTLRVSSKVSLIYKNYIVNETVLSSKLGRTFLLRANKLQLQTNATDTLPRTNAIKFTCEIGVFYVKFKMCNEDLQE